MNNLTKRGWFVVAMITALSAWGLWEIAAHLLWVGDGWRWCENLLDCEGK